VSREHRRAKTDRLDTELLMRALLGWLRGEKRHWQFPLVAKKIGFRGCAEAKVAPEHRGR